MDKNVKKKIKRILRIIFPPYRKIIHYYVKQYYEVMHTCHKLDLRERAVIAGNKKLMEQIEFLKFRAYSLNELHESIVQKQWPHDGSFKDKKCLEPFRNIEILPRGEVYTCCSAFLKHGYSIGNIYTTNDFNSIWNSENALKLRYSITNGNFEYCQKTCKYLCNENQEYVFSDQGFPIVSRSKDDKVESYKDCRVKTTPKAITLSCDKSCNLYCPSCRTNLDVLNKADADILYERLMKIVRPMLKDCEALNGLGSGDLFASNACCRFYKTLDIKEFPNLSLNIITNFQLLTEAKWQEFVNLHAFPIKFSISVDAAKKETYEKLRKGGKWENLCKNLEYFKEWRKRPDNKINNLSLNFIIQKDNFEEIEQFCHFAESVNADMIWFQQITNWGTYTDEEFKKVNVFDKDNQNREKALQNLKSVLEKKWTFTIIQNIL